METTTNILTPDQRLRIFVSSTLQELLAERKAARAAITELRMTPVMFELGARPHPPRDLYRSYLEQSHIFVGIYWQRYGWVAPGEEVSGLEDEYRLSGDRPKLIYVKTPAPERAVRLKRLLSQIQNDDQASYKPFSTPRELRGLIENDLALLLTERFTTSLGAASKLEQGVSTLSPPSLVLPLPPTLLIGREREIAEVSALLLDKDVRLVTLTGPGGIGKSRLGLELAHRLQGAFKDGLYFVPLAQITDPELVVPAIAGVLGVREERGTPLLEGLKQYLRGKQLLLLLDNFEQIEPAAPVLGDLLTAAPDLKMLVTSRSALHLLAEHLYEVPPLALPNQGASPFDAIRATEAVQLFVERSKAVRPSFTLTVDNALAIAEICYRLDGLPLAIELAAARISLLPPQALLKRLDKRFDLLKGGARDLPSRQQTLRNTIDWSYELLNAAEKELFARLAVFVGGCSLEAAEAVCAEENLDTLEDLASLVDKSLVQGREQGSEPHFVMFETIHAYALEKLEASGELETIRQRHADYYLALAEEAEPHLTGAQQALWLERLEREHSNLRAALSWAERSSEAAEINLCLAGALWRFWYARGYLSEARAWLTRALARVKTASSGTYAKALQGAGVLADAQGDYALARSFLEKALTIRRRLGDQEGVAAALSSLGLVVEEQGDPVSARMFLSESLAVRRELGDTWGVAASLTNLGKVAYDQGDYAASRPLFEESLALFQSLGDKARIAALLTNMGSVTHAQGDYEGARTLHEEGLTIWRELADDWGVAISLYNLGEAAHGQGDDALAGSLFGESLAMFWRMGDKKSTADCFEKLADLAARKEPERAARLWGAAEGLRDALGSPLAPHEHSARQGQVETARTRLGEVRFAAALAEGRNSELEGIVALALQIT